MRGSRLAAVLGLALPCAGGCAGTPTPLAPNLEGSVGVPHHGVLNHSAELPVRGHGFSRLRPKSPTYFGNPRLVRALVGAAESVVARAPGGAPLFIGDISARQGGKLPGHRSHRTGRDVDLLYFVTTPAGAPVPSPGFVKFGTDGLASTDPDHFVRFDVERNWLLVRALLLSTEAEVQWIFASRGVEALLIDYARARGEDPRLVWRAETVLLEPGDSSPHDDHFHLRIACNQEEMLRGCEGGGPRWEWLSPEPTLGDLDDELLSEIAREDPLTDG